MNRITTTLAAALLGFCALGAQARAAYTDKNGDEYEFRPHWYLQLQGGAQYTLGEAKFGDLISPNVQAAIGRQFSPVLGLRLSVNAWRSKGGWNGYKASSTAEPGNITYKWKYVAPSLDLMVSLSNALCGWNPNRTLNVSAFLGGGVNYAGGNGEANSLKAQGYELTYCWTGKHIRPVGRGGVAVDFRLSDCVSLGLEGNANITTDKYNSKKAGNADWYFNALAGLRINLGKTCTKKEKAEPVRPVEEYVAPKPAPEPAPAPAVERKAERMERDIFFTINSAAIAEEEVAKVSELAAYLNAHSGAKVEVTGYADAGTGNDVINDRIAEKRAESVKAMLVEKYGIDGSRVSVSSKGSRVQPFAENDKNRVSVCVAE